jgi:hypothetical protein
MTDISTQTEPKKMIDVNALTVAEMEDMCEDQDRERDRDRDQDRDRDRDQEQEAMEELYKMYDEMLERDNEAPQYIGYCGFPCDGYCYECNGRDRFDMADEI